MLKILRTEFYMRKTKSLIKTVIGRCRAYTIYKGMTQGQIMAALPTSRTVLTRPFTSTDVDFDGPFDIRNYTCLITKGYVYLFICFTMKAIHLEAVSNLSTSPFLAASKILKREFREFLK